MTKDELDALYFRALGVQEKGDFDAAFQLFLRGALAGDGAAQNALGNAYCVGEGCEKNEKTGIEWYKKAYRTGKQVGYLANVAVTYSQMGNRALAIKWWRKAVALGDGGAAMNLALYLMKLDEVLELVKMAASCEGNWQISPLEKEEAEDLLAILTRANWD